MLSASIRKVVANHSDWLVLINLLLLLPGVAAAVEGVGGRGSVDDRPDLVVAVAVAEPVDVRPAPRGAADGERVPAAGFEVVLHADAVIAAAESAPADRDIGARRVVVAVPRWCGPGPADGHRLGR